MSVAVAILLGFAVLVELLCAIGMLMAPNPFARLHYLGPAAILGPVAVAIAVVVANGLSSASFKAVFIAVVLLATSPILTHATARAALSRSRRKPALPEEARTLPEER